MSNTFDIVINYTGDPAYEAAFTYAVMRWEQIIVADIPDVTSSPYGFIDDLEIDAGIGPIDGAGGVVGEAGPDFFRSGSGLPAHGTMQFDSADVASMYANGTLDDVVLHEMGHVLGIGTLWTTFHLLNSAGDYIGAHALNEYRALSGNPAASSVSVEHDGGSGTAGGHWDEAIFKTELMTGYGETPGTPEPLSRMTIGSLQDLGYTVNYAAADPYSFGGSTNFADNGNNYLTATAGNNVLSGLGGNDTISGGPGNDLIYGNQGADLIYGNQDSDILYGGQGNDTVFGGQGGDVIYGNLANDIIYGNLGNDTLFGGQGTDALFGGQGNDLLFGNLGADILTGGLGADMFSFGLGAGADIVKDFRPNEGDRLGLGGQTYTISNDGSGGTLLTLSGGTTVDLAGVTGFDGSWVA